MGWRSRTESAVSSRLEGILHMNKWLRAFVAVVAMQSVGLAPAAAQPELELLTSYVGSWRGEGALVGGDRNEPFRCRLSIAKGNQTKVNYTGRCTLVNTTLSSGGQISFDLRERQKDRGGSDVRIGSRIVLVGGNITVDFEVEFNDSGEVLTASVPFSQ
jgi:hypothetical protein